VAAAAGGREFDGSTQSIVGACGQTHVKHYAGKSRLTGDRHTDRRPPGQSAGRRIPLISVG
jgi:hypothetical protein